MRRSSLVRCCAAALLAAALPSAAPADDLHFDYTSFETGFQQSQFNVLNYPSINGNFMMTSTDNHRPEMVANNNNLAQFYNNFNADYNHPTAERRTPTQEAAFINTYATDNSTNNGARPEWLILNEISSSQWQLNPGAPSLSEHRTWVIDTVTLLNDVYGYKVITYSPYETVGTGNAASWQALAAKSYIGIESYQSGTEVWNSGANNASRLAWAQGKYQSSKDTYMAAGVSASRLFISEHFANNAATYTDGQGNVLTTGWGRAGLASAANWDSVIQIRQDAILNVGFEGFLAYNWGGNGMGVSQAEQIQHEYYYRSRRVLPSQKPQWLSDSAINVNGTTIPLSWNQPLNWLGGVPNASGAEANFWRTLTDNRTITLDGSKTVGIVTFDSTDDYTISPGTGGSLTFDNSDSAATLTSKQGNHTIGVDVQLAGNLNAAVIADTLTISRPVSGAGALTKSGAGTLILGAANSYTGATTISAGVLRVGNTLTTPGAAITVAADGELEASSIVQRALVNNGIVAGPTSPSVLALSGPVSGAGSFTGNIRIDGAFSPGNGPGVVSFERVAFNDSSTLTVELGSQFDRVVASSAMTLDGTLTASLMSGFSPAAGNSFNILDWGSLAGTFDSLELPALNADLMWNASRLYVDGTLRIALAGDYNFSGVVDSADLLLWRSHFGESGAPPFLQGNGDADHDVDGADFLAWQRQVGMGSANVAADLAVPELETIRLLAIGAGAALLAGHRRRRLNSFLVS